MAPGERRLTMGEMGWMTRTRRTDCRKSERDAIVSVDDAADQNETKTLRALLPLLTGWLGEGRCDANPSTFQSTSKAGAEIEKRL